MKVLLLSGAEVKKLLSISEVIGAVEECFKAKGRGRVRMPPKVYIPLPRHDGDFRVMPAYLEDLGAAGAKIVNVHPRNPHERGLPSVMATILLLDPGTGIPLAIMDGTWITDMRTGAAGAIAAKYLARGDSRTVAMVGSGAQARAQLLAMSEVLDIGEVRVASKTFELAKRYADEMGAQLGIEVVPMGTVEEAVTGADVVTTTTPVREPIVMGDWISPGTHINAIGADAPGKQELDPRIFKRAKIVVDDREQALRSGELNVPFSQGLIREGDIYADISEVILGEKPGRTSEEEITVFDSTGLAIQDIATAWLAYVKARSAGEGREVEL